MVKGNCQQNSSHSFDDHNIYYYAFDGNDITNMAGDNWSDNENTYPYNLKRKITLHIFFNYYYLETCNVTVKCKHSDYTAASPSQTFYFYCTLIIPFTYILK